MNEEEEELYPPSAISSWSGFVYQGKIALYHCLKLLLQDELDFDLQLDSTEDFAIYRDGLLISAHQVKAKVGKYRSNYTSALEKASNIEGDRIRGTTRYIHVSVEINDTCDFVAPNEEVVSFYDYGTNKYCGLGDIEDLIKQLIIELCQKEEVLLSEVLVNTNYCLVSEIISTQAIEIHRRNQVDGLSEDEAAYTYTIKSSDVLSNILNNSPYTDIEYFALELKNDLYKHLEIKLDSALPTMSEAQYSRAKNLFFHIYQLELDELKHLCQLIKPSEKFSKIQKMDISRYSSLIQKIFIDPNFNGIPHYTDKCHNFYLPTAISLNDSDESLDCINQIKQETKNNKTLLFLLFEYGNLIAAQITSSFVVESKITDVSESGNGNTLSEKENNITKELNISVITLEEAEGKINA
ncbi:ABC-three component system protein [Psychrobacter sp. SWN149]|uniref:ABC-three component system protein n=1 Tax=Psychrobacter sp. SWN149 TaxID=2792057 RepID=UPI0018CFD0FB|nr:ABC-three component system protein [Psychrobacter sp. SWN149]MBH0007391.1 hypothetical protein [Psychrobacter sp. SWN149]